MARPEAEQWRGARAPGRGAGSPSRATSESSRLGSWPRSWKQPNFPSSFVTTVAPREPASTGRSFDPERFAEVYGRLICGGRFNEDPDYYPRYTARYRAILERFAGRAGAAPLDVLDVGGGQLALLARALWGDRAVAADIGGEHLGYLESQGVATVTWNLCSDPSPFQGRFDVIFFSEVIEHIPLPGHEVLARLKGAARPGALLVCTTPNLYRLRNVAFLLSGRQIFDHFRVPSGHGLGHVLEYSRDHLAWQLDRAGWRNREIEFVQIPHEPVEVMQRVLYRLGSPLFMVERFRDTLMAIARA